MAEQTNLPSIPPPNENNLVAFARAVKEALEVRLGRRGQGLDAMVTFRDLEKVQMVQSDGRGGVAGLKPPAVVGTVGGSYNPAADTTPPTAPQNVKASGAVRNVIIEWDGPPSTYRNHAYAEIWRSSANNLNDAAQIGQSGSTMYVDAVGEGQTRYYWVRFVSQANVTGPWHAAGDAGAQAVTALDVTYALGLLAGQIGESALATEIINGKDAFVFDTKTFAIRFNETGYTPFVVQSEPTTINGIEIPAGVYLDAAFMRTFVAQKGQIGELAVDDAAIDNLSAAKLTAGDGTIGGRLKSSNYVAGETGWIVRPDGTAEFAGATVRGTIYADTGWFKGQIIGGNATTYASGAGMWTGDDDDIWKFRLGSDGTYLRWDGSSLTLRGTLTIEDGAGNVLLSAGEGVPWGRISGAGRPEDGATVGMLATEQSTGYTSENGWTISKDGTFSSNGGGNQLLIGLNSARINFNKPNDGGTSFAVDEQGNALFSGQLMAATGTFAGMLQAGVLDPSAFAGIVYTYSGPGSHTPVVPAKPAGWATMNMRVTLVGAGGGGGGCANKIGGGTYGDAGDTSWSRSFAGGGGGAGQLTTFVIANVTPGTTYALTVGSGGAGGAGSSAYTLPGSGANGGATSMAGIGSASGGTGGSGAPWASGSSTWNNSNGPGGSLGGQNGLGDYDSGFLAGADNGKGGAGGSSAFGAGGTGGYGAAGSHGGTGAGGGGGGGAMSGFNGGAGGNGYAIVEFFDKDSVITNTRYSNLIAWLDTIGHGAVPSNAR